MQGMEFLTCWAFILMDFLNLAVRRRSMAERFKKATAESALEAWAE
jgi:hypothetical protein